MIFLFIFLSRSRKLFPLKIKTFKNSRKFFPYIFQKVKFAKLRCWIFSYSDFKGIFDLLSLHFIDFLDRYNCRSRVHPLNVYGAIIELSRQEIIQKPYLMIRTFNNALSSLKVEGNFSSKNIKAFYRRVKATDYSVIRLFEAQVGKEVERNAINYL